MSKISKIEKLEKRNRVDERIRKKAIDFTMLYFKKDDKIRQRAWGELSPKEQSEVHKITKTLRRAHADMSGKDKKKDDA